MVNVRARALLLLPLLGCQGSDRISDGELALMNLTRALAATGSGDALLREAETLSLSRRVEGEIARLTSATH